jgi:4-hydroxy-3-methylbut-2-enyl diphosphate reductase
MSKPSYLIEDANALRPEWLDGVRTLGITAGASAPEMLVEEVIGRLGALRTVDVQTLEGIEENVHFRLPDELEAQAGTTP